MKIAGKEFKNHTYVMGILNVTDNSFSDGGKFSDTDSALKHTEQMIAEGADIIDVGGESTRPGYEKISDEEEISRVAPVIEAIKSRFDIPVSVDTYKSRVCRAAAIAGADMINDIWGFKYDGDIAKIAAEYNMSACLSHNRHKAEYTDFVNDVVNDLKESISIARSAGVSEIVTDPGVGFAKSYEQNLKIMREIDAVKALGYPVLLGASRKSVIGTTLGTPVDKRLSGTIATSVYAVMHGCLFVRVHDVLENKQAIEMTERIIGI